MPKSRICSIDGCGKPHFGRGWCGAHYSRWKRQADINKPVRTRSDPDEMDQFFQSAIVYKGNECLLWPFATYGGYAKRHVKGYNGMQVHRIICQIVHGEPPSPSHQAAHNCGNGNLGCVAPTHLRWATPLENQADRIPHGTHVKGEQIPWARLTEDDVVYIRSMANIMRQADLALMFHVTHQTIWSVINRVNWKHVA